MGDGAKRVRMVMAIQALTRKADILAKAEAWAGEDRVAAGGRRREYIPVGLASASLRSTPRQPLPDPPWMDRNPKVVRTITPFPLASSNNDLAVSPYEIAAH